MKGTLALLLVTIAASFVLDVAGGEFERLSAEAAKKYTIATHEGSQYATKFSDWSTEPMLHAMNVCESQPFTNRHCDIVAVVAADEHIRRVLYSPSNAYADCVRKDLRLGAVAPKPPCDNWPVQIRLIDGPRPKYNGDKPFIILSSGHEP